MNAHQNHAGRLTSAMLCAAVACAAVAPAAAVAQQADIARKQAKVQVTHRADATVDAGPAAYFTGVVHVRPLIAAAPPSSHTAAWVTFEPGARAAWHTHPRGQHLLVTSGAGRVQQWGQPADAIGEGDVVFIPAGVKHWHGATPTTAMSHIAVQDSEDGRNVVWLEKVTDAQYAAAVPRAATSP